MEVGPSNILANMSRRTRDSKYLTQDALLCLQRLFLASTKDIKQIGYEYSSEIEVLPGTSEDVPPPVTQEMERKVPESIPQAIAVTAASVADVPTPALEIVRALVAYKLRKPIEQITPGKSIKDLSAGAFDNLWYRRYDRGTLI